MHKRKTLKKLVNSLDDIPSLKTKDKVKFFEFKSSKRMRNKKYVSKALFECLMANDTEGFKEILRVYLELENKEKFAKEVGIPKRTLFRILSENGESDIK